MADIVTVDFSDVPIPVGERILAAFDFSEVEEIENHLEKYIRKRVAEVEINKNRRQYLKNRPPLKFRAER